MPRFYFVYKFSFLRECHFINLSSLIAIKSPIILGTLQWIDYALIATKMCIEEIKKTFRFERACTIVLKGYFYPML